MILAATMLIAAPQEAARCTRNGQIVDCVDTTQRLPDYAGAMARGNALVPPYQPRAKPTVEQQAAARVRQKDCAGATKLALDAGDLTLAAKVKAVCN